MNQPPPIAQRLELNTRTDLGSIAQDDGSAVAGRPGRAGCQAVAGAIARGRPVLDAETDRGAQCAASGRAGRRDRPRRERAAGAELDAGSIAR